MKTNIFLLALLCVLSFFISCDKDDEDDNDETITRPWPEENPNDNNSGNQESQTSIVGTWEHYDWDGYYEKIEILEDGTGTYVYGKGTFSITSYTYIASSKRLTITFDKYPYGLATADYEVKLLTPNQMVLYEEALDEWDEGDTYVFRRKGFEFDVESDASGLAGTWEYREGTYTERYTFYQDGNGIWEDIDTDYLDGAYDVCLITYTYNPLSNKLIVIEEEDAGSDVYEYDVESISQNRLVLIDIDYEEEEGERERYVYTRRTGSGSNNQGNNNQTSSDYKTLIVGTWSILQDDTSWKSIATFNSNGTYTSKDYYFSEYYDTYNGTFSINNSAITIGGDAIISGSYTIQSMTESKATLVDIDGYRMYMTKQ